MPRFTERAKMLHIDNPELTIYYDAQCPFITQNIEQLKQYCDINEIPLSLTEVTTLAQAKDLPGVFNNYGVFYQGKFETVNLLDVEHLKRLLSKQ
ncbi:hypothetical protein SDC9_134634 [bioreactor metagenome]|uniref:YoaP-like domain-containing protein n=1 Tax=bioreactor metagenome TaxID=1076179 RepID=A0A645DE95_9ZZZZ